MYHVERAAPYHDLTDRLFPQTERLIEARASYVYRALRVARRQHEPHRARCLDRKLKQLNATRALLDKLEVPDVIDDNWMRQLRARLSILEARSHEILRASYGCSWANRPRTIVTVRLFAPPAPPVRTPRSRGR